MKKKITLEISVSHGGWMPQRNAPLARQSEHRRVIQEVLQRDDGLQNPPQVLGVQEAGGSEPAHCINVERQATLSELEPRNLAPGEPPDELLVDVAERYHRRPNSVNGRLHDLRLEDEDDDLRVLGA